MYQQMFGPANSSGDTVLFYLGSMCFYRVIFWTKRVFNIKITKKNKHPKFDVSLIDFYLTDMKDIQD